MMAIAHLGKKAHRNYWIPERTHSVALNQSSPRNVSHHVCRLG